MKYVFITGMGRSGTKFLTTLLQACDGVDARHEFTGNRESWLLSWYLPASVYTEPFLLKEKTRIEKEINAPFFIDINGYLQNSVNELHEIFKPIKVFHLVRHPHEVVRSLYTRRNENDTHLVPKTREEMEQWLSGDKFWQICWNWASTTNRLLDQNTELVMFEKIQSDFDYFSNKILLPLGLTMSKTTWEKLASVKVNKTHSPLYRKVYAKIKGKTFIEETLPTHTQWTDEQKQVFENVCGGALRRCGYE